jgi:hypothetical protein
MVEIFKTDIQSSCSRDPELAAIFFPKFQDELLF